ncbi:Gfo/Idh/MocA family protein [Vibrio sp. WXL103]|uniref:Gfo/Idh/MocA family protein n=1 Tax=Vibrio sp. WXL103 TaxID=3450710 RepID=UPI003EC90DB7
MKIAVVGLGRRAVMVLNDLYAVDSGTKLVGYCDPNPVLLNKLNLPVCGGNHQSVPDMLVSVVPDLLLVASPNHLHLEHVRAGLEAGVKVFCEKPLVSSLEQTWKMAGLLCKYGSSRLMVGMVLRYSQHMLDLKKVIADGTLGRIVSLEACEHILPSHGAFFMRDWRRFSRYSGGYMLEKCCHDLDLYHMLVGSRPSKVASFGARAAFVPEFESRLEGDQQYHQRPSYWRSTSNPFTSEADIVDHQTAILQFENGVSMTFHTNTNSPELQRRFSIYGTHGMAEGEFEKGYLKVHCARTNQLCLDIDYTQDPQACSHHYGADLRMANLLSQFLRCDAAPLAVTAKQALEAGIIALSIDSARRLGEVIDLQPLWHRLDAFPWHRTGCEAQSSLDSTRSI